MVHFSPNNFWKKNTPDKVEFVGNIALVLGGIGVALGFLLMGVKGFPNSEYIDPLMIFRLTAFGAKLSWWSAIVCGGVKAVSKCFGVPLKDTGTWKP